MTPYQILSLVKSQAQQPGDSILNDTLRQNLLQFASEYELESTQDNVGNICISRRGRDPGLSSIAITFPLDSYSSETLVSSAVKSFDSLLHSETSCGISLLGFSSPGNQTLGRDVFDGKYSPAMAYGQSSELRQFADIELGERSGISVAALVEVNEVASQSLTACGSLVLTKAIDGIRNDLQYSVELKGGGPQSKRAPTVRLEGENATRLCKSLIESYSEYVAALFENFD